MKKILIGLFIVAMLVLVGCSQEYMKECDVDSDCIIVGTIRCTTCECTTAINKEYKEQWDDLGRKNQNKTCDFNCKMCVDWPERVYTKCIDNKCARLINTTMI